MAAAQLDLRLWALVKDGQRAEARTRRHFAGLELLVTVDGELVASEVIRPGAEASIEPAADRHRAAFEAEGWTPAGPRG